MILFPADLSQDTAVTLAAVSCALLAGTTTALWLGVVRLRRAEARLAQLDRLKDIQASLQLLQEQRGALDLRRLEHVLLDIRDGQKRVEDRTLAVLESARGGTRVPGALEPAAAGSATALADRIVTRLLALGYERVQLVTPIARIAELAEGGGRDGEISIEARRDGAACKGRILVKKGAIADVQLQSAYSAFP
jgi:hypothetical protein